MITGILTKTADFKFKCKLSQPFIIILGLSGFVFAMEKPVLTQSQPLLIYSFV